MRPFSMKKLVGCVVASAMLAPLSGVAQWGGKGTFSPIYMLGSNGKPQKITWTYAVNSGQPLYVQQTGANLCFRFGDLVLTIDPVKQQRVASLLARISGDARGTVVATVTESLAPLQGKTLVNNQEMKITMKLTQGSISVSVLADILCRFSPAAEWFLDRNDLDQLGTGFTYNGQGNITGTVLGSVTIKLPPRLGGTQTVPIATTTTASPESWEITDVLSTFRVGTKTYSDVVVVDRETVVPVFQFGGATTGGGTESATVTYWVAKGIGMVRGIGQYRFLDQDLTIDLKSTTIPYPLVSSAKWVKANPKVTGSQPTVTIAGSRFGQIMGAVFLNGNPANSLTIQSWTGRAIKCLAPGSLLPGDTATLTVQADSGAQSAPCSLRVPSQSVLTARRGS